MSDQNNWPDSDEDNHSERNQLGYVSRLCPVSISITEETRDANGQRVSSFHVHVKNRQRSEAPRFTAKVTLLSLWLTAAEGWIYPRLTRRSSTRHRNSRPTDNTDNNPAHRTYYISPRASGTRYWRTEHRRSRLAETPKPRRRPAKRWLLRADPFSV